MAWIAVYAHVAACTCAAFLALGLLGHALGIRKLLAPHDIMH